MLRRRFIRRLAVAAVVSLISLILIEAALQWALWSGRMPQVLVSQMPNWATLEGIRYDTPSGMPEYPPGQVRFEVNQRIGLLNSHACGQSSPDEIPYTVEYARDDHGFRNPTPWPDQADLVVTGDSFTDAYLLAHPFTDGLPVSTLNLGLLGTGTIEQLHYLRAYGFPRKPKVVILFYYEGNDLANNWETGQFLKVGRSLAERDMPSGRPFWDYWVSYHMFYWLWRNVLRPPAPGPCNFVVQADGQRMVMYPAVLEDYTIPRDTWDSSAYFAATRDALLSAGQETESAGAKFVLAYIPDKAYVYWDGLNQSGAIDSLSQHLSALKLTDTGVETDSSITAPADIAQRMRQNVDVQHDLLARLAADNGWLFLDFTPDFRQTAAVGSEALYFFADIHWNAAGNELAHCVLRRFLNEQNLLSVPNCS